MKKIYSVLLLLLTTITVYSQRGKDGTVTIAAGSSTVNVYTSLTSDAAAGTSTIAVANAAGYTTGDLIYIIQMQGTSTNCWINIWGNINSPEPYSADFGRITAYNNTGLNEYAQVASVSGNIITIDCSLKNNYTAAGKVQVIKVPRYAQLSITGTITCPAWNGTTGGVIAIEVLGTTTFASTGRIDASSKGFRGGAVVGKTTGINGGGSWGHNNPLEGGYKGEGIVGDTAYYNLMFNGQYAKGAIANAGGGGNPNNCGGGGGSNAGDTSVYNGLGNPDVSTAGYITAWNLESAGFATNVSSGGGRGGYSYSSANISPITNAPNNSSWGGDNRRPAGGYGGRPLDYTTGRLFLGGGGGAGDENDAYAGSGGNGGGIINIISYSTISGGGQIKADGQNGYNTNTTGSAPVNNCNGRDGAGGAGGGGAIKIITAGGISNTTLTAMGGAGGNQQMKSGFIGLTAQAYGPGGGGGGGYIGTTSNATVISSVTGGTNGIVQYLSGNENCQIDNLFPANGATKGGNGIATSSMSAIPTITATPGVTICANNSTTLSASTTGTGTIGWYTQTAGGTLLGTGTAFTTSVFTTPGTYTIYSGFCPGGIYRVPVTISVTASPTLIVSTPTICSGSNATITASGATTYSWNTGATTSSITPSPTTTTNYTLTGSNGSCSTTAIATVVVNTSGTISINSPTICNGQTATLTAGAAASYTWNTGSNNSSITITPTVTTTYTINALTAGGCSMTNTTNVTVSANPTVSVANATICSGQTSTLSASGATSYSWNTGATTSSITPSPTTTTNYTITGTTGLCTNTKTVTLTVNTTPTVTVNSSTLCSGGSATLTASGASTYSWNTGATTSSIIPTPTITTNYTVTGTSSGCNDVKTATITVNTTPTVVVNSSTICSGNSATLSASGATSFSWNTGATTSSIIPTPTITTNYTVTGNSSGCTDIKTATITVNTTPTVSVNSATICSGSSATLTASGAATYSWNTGATTSSVTPSPTITTNYTVTGTNSGCVNVKTATITVVTTPTVAVTSPTTCAGSPTTITASGATTYSWSTGATTASVSVSPASTSVYTVTGFNGSCSSQITTTINVTSAPTLSLNSTSFVICSPQSASIIATTSSGTYSWNTGATTNSIVTSTAGIYTVNVTNNCGVSTQTANVTISSTPAFTIVPSSTLLCSGQTITLTTIGSSGTFSWSTGASTSTITTNVPDVITATVSNACGSSPSSNTINFATGTSPSLSITASAGFICPGNTVTLTATGTGSVVWSVGSATTTAITITNSGVYTATSTTECGSTSSSFNILTGPPPTVSITSAGIFCIGQTITLTASGATTYSWNTGSSGSSISTSAAGIYTASGTDACGTGTSTFAVAFASMPSVSVSASQNTICPGQTATLTANGTNGGMDYSWFDFPTNITGIQTVSVAGSYLVTYTNACGTSTAISTIVQSSLTPNFVFTPNGGTAPVSVSFTNTSSNNNSNQWNFGNGQTSGNINESGITYSSAGIYTVSLVIQNSDGCLATISQTLEVIDEEFGPIPEVITANGDGKNDFFNIRGLERFANNELQIFNRWGNLVYKTKGYNNTNAWNGKRNGGNLPTGTYFYIFDRGDGQIYKGYIELLY